MKDLSIWQSRYAKGLDVSSQLTVATEAPEGSVRADLVRRACLLCSVSRFGPEYSDHLRSPGPRRTGGVEPRSPVTVRAALLRRHPHHLEAAPESA